MSNNVTTLGREGLGPVRSYSEGNAFLAMRNAANLFGWQKKEDLPDPTLLTEAEGFHAYRDLQELDSKLSRIKSVRLEEALGNHVRNAFHGSPMVTLATQIVYDYVGSWESLRADIEQVAWNESPTAGIPDGSTYYSYKESGSSTRYKYVLPILFEVLDNPDIGRPNLAFQMRMLRETCITTIMKNTSRALAFRPYRNFRTQHQRAGKQMNMLDLYRRAVRYMFEGVKRPDVLLSKVQKLATNLGMDLDTIMVPDISTPTLDNEKLDNKVYNSVMHDTTGKQEGFTNGIKELTYKEQSTVAIGGIPRLLLAMPSFRIRREHAIEQAEQSLAKRLTLAQCSPFRRPMLKSGGLMTKGLDQMTMSTTVAHVTPSSLTWRGFSLAFIVQRTGCGFWFDTKTGEYSKDADHILRDRNLKSDDARQAHYDAIASLDSMDEPTPAMRASVKNSLTPAPVGWRNALLFESWDENSKKFVKATTFGKMEECILPTRLVCDALEIFVAHHPTDAAAIIKRNGSQAAPSARGAPRASEEPVAPGTSRFQTRELNTLLTNLPNPVFDLVHAQGHALERMFGRSGDVGKRLAETMKSRIAEQKTLGHARVWTKFYLATLAPYMREQAPETLTSDKAGEISNLMPAGTALHADQEEFPTGERARTMYHKSREYESRLKGAVLAGSSQEDRDKAIGEFGAQAKYCSATRLAVRKAVAGQYSPDVIEAMDELFQQRINLFNLVRLLKLGLPLIGGRLERFSMRFLSGSLLMMKRGASCCKQHITPMLAHWGMVPVEGRILVTAQFNEGFEFGDEGAIEEMPNVFPIAHLGGMLAGLITDLGELRKYFASAKYTSTQKSETADLIFLPRPISEMNDDFPQYAFSRTAEVGTGLAYQSETLLFKLSSCHMWLQELLQNSPLIKADQLNRMLMNPSTRGEFAPHLSPFVERAPSYDYNTVANKWDGKHDGTGPMGELRLYCNALIDVMKGEAGSFPELPPDSATIESFDAN